MQQVDKPIYHALPDGDRVFGRDIFDYLDYPMAEVFRLTGVDMDFFLAAFLVNRAGPTETLSSEPMDLDTYGWSLPYQPRRYLIDGEIEAWLSAQPMDLDTYGW